MLFCMIDISWNEALAILKKISGYSDNEALTEFISIVNVKGIDGALNDIGDMNKKYYLKQHPYEIYDSEHDKRYRTYLPPQKDGEKRKPITAVSKENLENKIVTFYKQKDTQPASDTLEKIYPAFLDYKGKETSLANAHKLNWIWEKYYKGDDIIKCRLSDITVVMLKSWFLDQITKYGLTSRKYKEMKSLMNMLYDYAIESNLTNSNVSRLIHGISYKKFVVEREKKPTEQVYIDDEEEKLIHMALEQYEKTENTAYLGICLNFTLALRVGEIAALKTSDFSESLVHIQRQEIRNYEKLANGEIIRSGYAIVPYGKTPNADRELLLTGNAKVFFSMIVKANEKRNFHSEYLLLDKNGDRIKSNEINKVLKRLNKMIQTTQKGNHSIRKTCISNMGESGALSNEEIRNFAGHKDFSTTEKYYMHSTVSIENRSEAYERAINSKIGNVFKTIEYKNKETLVF